MLPNITTPSRLIIIRLTALAVCAFALLANAASARDLGLKKWVTPQGVQVLFMQASEIPMIDLAIDVDAGSRWDIATQAGLASMTSSLLARGVRAQDGLPAISEQQINDRFAELAAGRSSSASLDRASISLRFLSDAEVRDGVIGLVSRLIAHPAFDADTLDREKKRVIASIQESLTQPQSLATRALWSSVYAGHPYGLNATAESIGQITVQSLRDFHARHWRADRMRLTIVGAIDEPLARRISEQLFIHLPQSSAKPVSVAATVPGPITSVAPTRQAIAHPASQSHIWLGQAGIARDDPDFFALTVANYIFGGGGFVSRLTEEVREKRGLSYSVFSAFQPLAQPGPFMIGLQTQRARAPEALEVVRTTLANFLRDGPTEQELKAAKQNLVGGFALRVDTNRKLLDNLSQMNFYDMPLDYLQTWTRNISAVSMTDIRRAMNRVVALDKLSVVVVAGPDGFKP